MTIVPLNKCAVCGTSLHMYLLKDQPESKGKVCKDEAACKKRFAAAHRREGKRLRE